jgi:DNA polymerase III subunit gamma/tau
MSYLVLARKWRPRDFSEIIGQQPVVRTLRNGLRKKRVAHAMLFSGVRGTGKTTLARIMAKALNCQDGPTDEPCKQCESCREIAAGNAIDLHEIDGASNRGIQEIRELKENIRFFPTKSRYKIIIIDEVHMLTPEAFNALLKTLEEPPAHVYFIFATTELHKLPITILSRCQRYELKRVVFAELLAHFKKIAEAEGVVISDAALSLIVREAGGSVRDGLSLLDQIFSFGGDEISAEDVRQVLGVLGGQALAELARTLLAGDLRRSLELLADSHAQGLDLRRFSSDLLEYFRGLLICSINPRASELLDLPGEELAGMQELAAGFSAESLYRYFQLLLQGIEEMLHSSHPRLVLEMTFIKASQAGQVVPVTSLLKKVDDLLRRMGPTDDGHGKREPGPLVALSEKQPVYESSQPLPTAPRSSLATAPDHKPAEAAAMVTELEPAPLAAKPAVASGSGREVRRHWEEFLDHVKERKQWMAHALRMSIGQREEDGRLLLKFDAAADCKMLQEPENMKLLAELVDNFFQRELKVRVKISGRNNEEGSGSEEEGSVHEERRSLANEPLVQMAAEVFGGQVVNIRTGPGNR